MQPEIQTADGDGVDETMLLANFLVHLGRVADARSPAVGAVMKGMIEEALSSFTEEFDNE